MLLQDWEANPPDVFTPGSLRKRQSVAPKAGIDLHHRQCVSPKGLSDVEEKVQNAGATLRVTLAGEPSEVSPAALRLSLPPAASAPRPP